MLEIFENYYWTIIARHIKTVSVPPNVRFLLCIFLIIYRTEDRTGWKMNVRLYKFGQAINSILMYEHIDIELR